MFWDKKRTRLEVLSRAQNMSLTKRVCASGLVLLLASLDASAKPTASPTTSAFFATPPASLSVPADFTAPGFFQTDFLKAFFPGFGPSQTSVEPQPMITDPVVQIFHIKKLFICD